MAKDAKYLQVTQWVMEQLQHGELKCGDRLESENGLSARFGLSRQTVRRALGILESQGIVERLQGSGTYIKSAVKPQQNPQHLSDTVTIISTQVNGYIFPSILQAMVGRLERAGYHSRIMFTGNRLATERRILQSLLDEGSRDPVIMEPVMSGLPNPNLDCYRQLQAAGIPILFFHSYYPELDIPYVGMDDIQAGRAATEYLIGQGHTHIGGIFKADDGQGRRRYQGYLQALIKAGLTVREECVCWIDTLEMTDFPEQNPHIWERLSGCTACVCYNDEVAHRLEEYAARRGIRIPEELSVVGFDDSELAKLSMPPLTSIAHPKEQLGEKTAENMLRLIDDPNYCATWEFPAEIAERGSVSRRGGEQGHRTEA